MSLPAGSPKGTIHLWPANVTDEEIESKGGLKRSLQEELDDMSCDSHILTAKNMHPFVDSEPIDPTPYLWSVYPTELAGRFKVILQGSILKNEEPVWKFWGSAYDFIYALKHEVPMITHLVIPVLSKDKAASDLFKESQKIGIKITEDELLGYEPKKIVKTEKSKVVDPEGYGAENLKEDALDPSTYSKLTDPGHQGFQVALGSRVGRIMKIALHIIRTPQDENIDNDPNKVWSVVPDQPSQKDEQEGIEYFRTRDQAAAWLNNHEEESSITAALINANDLGEWFEPEEAAVAAWQLRKSFN
jgi:hypothetical protein